MEREEIGANWDKDNPETFKDMSPYKPETLGHSLGGIQADVARLTVLIHLTLCESSHCLRIQRSAQFRRVRLLIQKYQRHETVCALAFF